MEFRFKKSLMFAALTLTVQLFVLGHSQVQASDIHTSGIQSSGNATSDQSTFANSALPLDASSFAIVGDGGYWNKNTQTLRSSIQSAGVQNLILPGDNIYRGTYEKAWNPWRSVGFLFPLVAIGNHNEGYAKEVKFFEMPSEHYSKVYKGQNGDETLFLVFNSDNRDTDMEQIAWARSEITQSKAEKIFFVYHHPTLTVSPEHKWEERKEFQLGIHGIIREFRSRITAIIAGHDHIATLAHIDDLPLIVSGATQDVRDGHSYDNIQAGFRLRTAWMFDNTPYWVRLDIDDEPVFSPTSASAAVFHFVRAKDSRIRCTVRIVTGQAAELDSNCGQ